MKFSNSKGFNKNLKKQSKEMDRKFYKMAKSLLNGNLKDSEKEVIIERLKSMV